MAWTWRMLTDAGDEVTTEAGTPGFPNQADAESWLGEEWPALVEQGVDGVVLLEGDREVYGPMSLHPPTP